MKRRLRIFRIWYFGKINLAKKIHVRVVYWKMIQRFKNERSVYYIPEHFNKAMNSAQVSYLEKIFHR